MQFESLSDLDDVIPIQYLFRQGRTQELMEGVFLFSFPHSHSHPPILPSLPCPFPVPSLLSPTHFFPFTFSLLPLEVGRPLNQLGGLGERCK